MMRPILAKGLTLGAFALITSGLIGLTHALTEQRIMDQRQQKQLAIIDEILPRETYDNALLKDCIELPLANSQRSMRLYRARLANEPVALIATFHTLAGYNGRMDIMLGVDSNMQVRGVRVLAHQETPGLGDKVDPRISDWITEFNHKPFALAYKDRWAVKKDGGQFDQFTGATITPRAVVNGVREVLIQINGQQQQLFTRPIDCQEP